VGEGDAQFGRRDVACDGTDVAGGVFAVGHGPIVGTASPRNGNRIA
jgi:hypothetical protein